MSKLKLARIGACFCRRWWRSQAVTESVGGLPWREEPVPVAESDRAGDRFDDALLALREAESVSDDAQHGSRAGEVGREWVLAGARMPIAVKDARGR